MAFKEKTIQVPTRSGDKVKHWASCPTAVHHSLGNDIFTSEGYNRYACTCRDKANAEYWRMDQVSNCAYESTGELNVKQLMFGVKLDGKDIWTGKQSMAYCCSKNCADMYRKEFV